MKLEDFQEIQNERLNLCIPICKVLLREIKYQESYVNLTKFVVFCNGTKS